MRGYQIERIERLITMKKYKEVLDILNILLKRFPNNSKIKEKIASIFLYMGDEYSAKKYLDKNEDLIKIQTLNDFRIIDELVAGKKYNDAIIEIHKFLIKYPNNNFARVRLAELHMALGNYKKASEQVSLEQFNLMKGRDDNMTKLQEEVDNLAVNGKYLEAFEAFKKILEKYEIRDSKNKLVELSILAGTKKGISKFISSKDYERLLMRNKNLDKFNYFK